MFSTTIPIALALKTSRKSCGSVVTIGDECAIHEVYSILAAQPQGINTQSVAFTETLHQAWD